MISEEDVYSAVSSNIKKLRIKHPISQKKLTQAELATAIGINRATLTNIEIGNQRSPLYVIYRICEYFSVDIDTLLPPVDSLSQATDPEKVEVVVVGDKTQKVSPMVYKLIDQARTEV